MWNRCAPSYVESIAPLTQDPVPLLLAAAHLSSGSRALEIGCGPGHITKMMAETGAHVIGVDIAPSMIAVARDLYPSIEFEVANVDDLPFESNNFDAVIANFLIRHLARPDRAFREVRRVLKPGGRFVFAEPLEQFGFGGFVNAMLAHHVADFFLEETPHGPITPDSPREEYEHLVVNAGFSEWEVTERQVTSHQDNLDAIFKTGWDMWELDKLPRETQEMIRKTAIENVELYKTSDGYDFPDRIVVGTATK